MNEHLWYCIGRITIKEVNYTLECCLLHPVVIIYE